MNNKWKFAGWTFVLAALLVYLPSLLVYLVHPGTWWIMGILSIGFAFTWLGMIPMVFIGWRLHKRLGICCLLTLLAGVPVMRNQFAVNSATDWKAAKAGSAIRIMQWNCMELPGAGKTDSSRRERQKVLQLLKKYQPDLLLLQDFNELANEQLHSNIAFLADTLGYRYFKLAPFYHQVKPWGEVSHGSAIFSKIPFVATHTKMYDGRPVSEQLVWTDICWNGKPLRLVSTHMLSMNLNTPKGLPNPVEYHQLVDTPALTSGSILQKLQHYQPYHVQQAAMLRHFMDTSSVPLILGIDMNSVPSSYVYQVISSGLQDVFLETGFGWGRTYTSRLPHLRIDYLFTSPGLHINQAHTVPVETGDHFPIVADLEWPHL